jgi:predicted CoA-binding protein
VGASEREDSLAAMTHRQLSDSGYDGDIYPVNPKYESLHGKPCYASLVDLVVRFSGLAFVLGGEIAEIDLNPVIVNQSGCTIVDALVVPK